VNQPMLSIAVTDAVDFAPSALSGSSIASEPRDRMSTTNVHRHPQLAGARSAWARPRSWLQHLESCHRTGVTRVGHEMGREAPRSSANLNQAGFRQNRFGAWSVSSADTRRLTVVNERSAHGGPRSAVSLVSP
jgi:hypothetical protein